MLDVIRTNSTRSLKSWLRGLLVCYLATIGTSSNQPLHEIKFYKLGGMCCNTQQKQQLNPTKPFAFATPTTATEISNLPVQANCVQSGIDFPVGFNRIDGFAHCSGYVSVKTEPAPRRISPEAHWPFGNVVIFQGPLGSIHPVGP